MTSPKIDNMGNVHEIKQLQLGFGIMHPKLSVQLETQCFKFDVEKMKIFENSSHMAHLEEPEVFIQALEQFFNETEELRDR